MFLAHEPGIGAIPNEIGKLVRLSYFDTSANELSGETRLFELHFHSWNAPHF